MDLQANRGVTRFMFINCVCCQSFCTPLWSTRGQYYGRDVTEIVRGFAILLRYPDKTFA